MLNILRGNKIDLHMRVMVNKLGKLWEAEKKREEKKTSSNSVRP